MWVKIIFKISNLLEHTLDKLKSKSKYLILTKLFGLKINCLILLISTIYPNTNSIKVSYAILRFQFWPIKEDIYFKINYLIGVKFSSLAKHDRHQLQFSIIYKEKPVVHHCHFSSSPLHHSTLHRLHGFFSKLSTHCSLSNPIHFHIPNSHP